MGRLQLAVALAVIWVAVAAHSAGVVLAPAPDQDSSGEPADPPVVEPMSEAQIACIISAVTAGEDPALVCEL